LEKSTLTLEERMFVRDVDINLIINILFPNEKLDEIKDLLDGINNINDINVIKRYCLILSEGSIDKLMDQIKVANLDYRDIIASLDNTKYGNSLIKKIFTLLN
jgi:hypothetical protein